MVNQKCTHVNEKYTMLFCLAGSVSTNHYFPKDPATTHSHHKLVLYWSWCQGADENQSVQVLYYATQHHDVKVTLDRWPKHWHCMYDWIDFKRDQDPDEKYGQGR